MYTFKCFYPNVATPMAKTKKKKKMGKKIRLIAATM